MSPTAPALELSGIEKAFGANKVLKGVTMALEPGRVMALLGANGAGKSTLIKILAGVETRDAGEIAIGGQQALIASPLDASRYGIQTVHQRIDESVIPGLTVAENLLFEDIVQNRISPIGSINRLLPQAREVASTLDLNWPDSKLRTDVFELGIADAQLLLLARALKTNPKVLVLDEPTSALSQSEADRLFGVIGRLRDEGVAILYVSHHLSEIRTLADDLVVLRDGQIKDRQQSPLDMQKAVTSMLGEAVLSEVENTENLLRGSQVALSLDQVQLLKRSKPVDLELRYGEVTGIVGLLGAGKTELAQGIFGAKPFKTGRLRFNGEDFAPKHAETGIKNGIYLVPENRAAEAMLPGWTLERTVTVPFMGEVSPAGLINAAAERRRGTKVIEDFSVVATGPAQVVDALSGGNQQKVVVGRWLEGNPKVILMDEPFRGVDIGARHDISRKAREAAAGGACVVVLSSDVDEIREVADRILVLVEGHIAMDKYAAEIDTADIVASMSEVAK
jgi:simple sugar transport system ATP-binding protein